MLTFKFDQVKVWVNGPKDGPDISPSHRHSIAMTPLTNKTESNDLCKFIVWKYLS